MTRESLSSSFFIILFLSIQPSLISAQGVALEIEGTIKIGQYTSTPVAGTLRFTGAAFEGWDGNIWIPLGKFKLKDIVTDIDSNSYYTVQIGCQEWMAENLRVTHYNDGSNLQIHVGSTVENPGATGSLYFPDDNPAYAAVYGALYDFHCIETGSLCPTGWHVPDDIEWEHLRTFLGGLAIAGGKLKESGTMHWNASNFACNDTGFTARAPGYYLPGSFVLMGQHAAWWSTTVTSGNESRWFVGPGPHFDVNKVSSTPDWAFGVRCLKD